MIGSSADIAEPTALSRLQHVQALIFNLLHAHAFHLATETPGSEVLTRTLTSIEKLSALEHKRRPVVLAREKLAAHANSARSPRRHQVDLSIMCPTSHLAAQT